MPVEVQIAENEVDAVLVFRAYKQMHAEGGIPGSIDDVKMLTNVIRMVKGPGSVVLMAMDGDLLVGVLSLWQDGYWYSTQDRHLCDKGFYVVPDARSEQVGTMLLDAAKTVSNDTKLPVFITIFNGKRKRGGRSGWERIGATLGYSNRGATLAHVPET